MRRDMNKRFSTNKMSHEMSELLKNYGTDTPYFAGEVIEFFKEQGLKTKDTLKVLGVNQNRYSQITKVDGEGIDMRHNTIVPQVEIFLRLMNIFPEAQNWHPVLPEHVMEKHNITADELSNICCNSESSCERWKADHAAGKPIKVTGYSTLLIEAMDRINHPMAKEVIIEVANRVKQQRYAYDRKVNAVRDDEADNGAQWLLPSTRMIKAHRSNVKRIYSEMNAATENVAKDLVKYTEYIKHDQHRNLELDYEDLLANSINPKSAEWLAWLRSTVQWIAAKDKLYELVKWRTNLEELDKVLDSVKSEDGAFKVFYKAYQSGSEYLDSFDDVIIPLEEGGLITQTAITDLKELLHWYVKVAEAETNIANDEVQDELSEMLTIERIIERNIEKTRFILNSSLDAIELCKLNLGVD